MPTILPGQVLSDTIFNPTGNPRFTQTDRSDVDDWGVIDLVEDDNLAPEPGNIKSNFYGWFERLQMSVGTGLSLSYEETRIRLTSGTIATLPAGSVILSANTSVYVYADNTPAIVASPTLPNVCAPLAWVTTDGSSVIAIEDLRDQQCEAIRVVSLPSVQSPWVAGDVKTTFRITPEPGWLPCNGQSLSRLDYPALFAAIQYTNGGSGNSFNLPDCRGRGFVGAGTGSGLTNRPLSSMGGVEVVTLTVNQMPPHTHNVTNQPHTHVIEADDHAHDATPVPHTHGTSENPHEHQSNYNRAALEGAGGGGIQSGGAEISQANSAQNFPLARVINAAVTGLSIIAASAGVVIRPAKVRVTAQPATQSVTVQNQGGGAAHTNMSPYIAANVFIRVV